MTGRAVEEVERNESWMRRMSGFAWCTDGRKAGCVGDMRGSAGARLFVAVRCFAWRNGWNMGQDIVWWGGQRLCEMVSGSSGKHNQGRKVVGPFPSCKCRGRECCNILAGASCCAGFW